MLEALSGILVNRPHSLHIPPCPHFVAATLAPRYASSDNVPLRSLSAVRFI